MKPSGKDAWELKVRGTIVREEEWYRQSIDGLKEPVSPEICGL
jgi:hypothetical protein